MSVPLPASQVAPASHRYSGFWEVLGRLREREVLWPEAADLGLSRTVYRLRPAAVRVTGACSSCVAYSRVPCGW